tara:strand:- start:258 stop:608 length:351 start_codon:yes stop_codon:yes gene_type:complete
MEKYLYFSKGGGNDAVDDVLCMPVSKFRGFVITAADAVSVTMTFDRLFESLTQDTDNEDFDNVDLVIASGSIKDVCRAITEAINFGKDPFITIADVENSEFIDANITGVASITIVR